MFQNVNKYLLALVIFPFATANLYSTGNEKTQINIFFSDEYEDFLEFIRDQPRENKLEWKQFQEIRELAKKVKVELESPNYNIIAILQLSKEKKIREMFNQLKQTMILEKNIESFEAAFFTYMSILAETAPSAFTKDFYLDLLRIKKSAQILKKESGEHAYLHYKARLASLLELDLGSVLNQYLLKEAMQRGVYSSAEIQKIKANLLALPSDKICAIIHGACGEEHQYLESQGYHQLRK